MIAAATLERAHARLGWPEPTAVTHPEGHGPAVYAALVRSKIGRSLASRLDGQGARLGVLMADHKAATSEPPLAIVAQFENEVDEDTLRELHRLSWNFSHAPTLVTIEPALMRVWTCCEAPDPDQDFDQYLVQTLTAAELEGAAASDLEAGAARALHWINLVSGQFFVDHAARFDRDGRADQMLLGNLREIRERLEKQGLIDDDICHDLLARVIFVQFLFDRKDPDGAAALDVAKLHRLYKDRVFHKVHGSFDAVLSDYDETYRLFDWLNTRFNGDLFPGKGDTPEARAAGWAREKAVVEPRHLALLAEFIRGDLDLASDQMCLWPQYAFDVIPLEFISSIYETFVTERASQHGIFYTPPHLVDFVLDRVLPWQGTEWDLKILDPACGSGIFLVKAFQRLVHRWKQAHPGQTIRAETLRRLLERNVFGVDKDPHAVRVACFSLYLAMCDEIEPRHYWTQVTFPSMRERRLVCSDFFAEGLSGFDTVADAGAYDLVIGNAPWGDGVITQAASNWALEERHRWTIPNNDIGGLFLAKGAQLARDTGRVAMIQSANSLLFNISPLAVDFRKELFSRHRAEAVYNLSALRFRVFKRKTHTTKTSAAPACVVILRREAPLAEDRFPYVSPKHVRPLIDEFTVVVEPADRRSLTVRDALEDPLVWSKLMWGSPRDLQLIAKLQCFPTLAKLQTDHAIVHQQGVTFGDRERHAPHLDGRRLFDAPMFPSGGLLTIDVADFDVAKQLKIHSRASTATAAFAWPQILIKQSWNKPSGRFHARMTMSSHQEGLLCNQSYLSVHADPDILEAVAIAHNSLISVYFHFLTSGRFAAYRPKLSSDEILDLPLPPPAKGLTDGVDDLEALDQKAFELFGLNEAERVLVEDAIDYTLDSFVGGVRARGDQVTDLPGSDEAHLKAYCDYFSRVLKAGFGEDRAVKATIYQAARDALPYRLVAFALGGDPDGIEVATIRSDALLAQLEVLNLKKTDGGGLFNQTVARLYEAESGYPTIFIVKPDKKRFWTRSMGLHDGDEVSLDLFRWLHTPVSETSWV
ncbi:MAG: restriction endonuclease subunit [Caulobacteraceae bacterium]|nr:restriction endonuclease subunit [Caulobacteraceae bacterium]